MPIDSEDKRRSALGIGRPGAVLPAPDGEVGSGDRAMLAGGYSGTLEPIVPLEDVLSAAVVRPVHIGFLDIRHTPVRGWSGPGAFLPTGTGDADLDDEVYLELESAIQITDFSEDQGIGGELNISFTVSEGIAGFIVGEGEVGEDFLGEPVGAVFDRIIKDRRAFLGRKAVIWLGFLSEDEGAVLPNIQRMFTGVMVNMTVQRQAGQPTMVTITCDQDTQKARTPPLRLVDHQQLYPTDTATSYINDLARGAIGTANPSSANPPWMNTPWDYSTYGYDVFR